MLGVFGWSSETWLTLATIATAGILLGTAAAALITLWDARRTRHASLIADLARRWLEPRAFESRELLNEYGHDGVADLIERVYRPEPPPRRELQVFWKLSAFPMLIEQIGVLHAERAISSRVVYRLWGAAIAAEWDAWRAHVHRLRELEGHPGVYAYFERLAAEMRRQIEKREGATWSGAGRAAT